MESTNINKVSITTKVRNIKDGAKTKFNQARGSFINLSKNFNTVKDTSYGVARGAVEGTAAIALIGLLGKNINEAKGQIAGTIGKSLGDIGLATVKTLGFIPSLITKSPLENITSVLKLPHDFYGTYLHKTPVTAFFATAAGLGILGFRTLQGKINANIHNANIDHALITGHANTVKSPEPQIKEETEKLEDKAVAESAEVDKAAAESEEV